MADDPLATIRAGVAARLEERKLLLIGDETQLAKARARLVRTATDFLVKRGTTPTRARLIVDLTLRTHPVPLPMPMEAARRLLQTLMREAARF
jgi:hypothetical protein